MIAFFIGNYYEVTDGVVTKSYYAGATRLATRTNGTLSYILADHLGSTSLVTATNTFTPTATSIPPLAFANA